MTDTRCAPCPRSHAVRGNASPGASRPSVLCSPHPVGSHHRVQQEHPKLGWPGKALKSWPKYGRVIAGTVGAGRQEREQEHAGQEHGRMLDALLVCLSSPHSCQPVCRFHARDPRQRPQTWKNGPLMTKNSPPASNGSRRKSLPTRRLSPARALPRPPGAPVANGDLGPTFGCPIAKAGARGRWNCRVGQGNGYLVLSWAIRCSSQLCSVGQPSNTGWSRFPFGQGEQGGAALGKEVVAALGGAAESRREGSVGEITLRASSWAGWA